jgi:hypothetical protein
MYLGEPTAADLLPESGTLLHVPKPPILTLNLRAHGSGALLIFFNAGDAGQRAIISSGLIQIESAYLCDLFDDRIETLHVTDGAIEITIEPRRIATLELS